METWTIKEGNESQEGDGFNKLKRIWKLCELEIGIASLANETTGGECVGSQRSPRFQGLARR